MAQRSLGGGGAVWRRGGIDDMNDEDHAEIYSEGCSVV
jgi:hypothetical protein